MDISEINEALRQFLEYKFEYETIFEDETPSEVMDVLFDNGLINKRLSYEDENNANWGVLGIDIIETIKSGRLSEEDQLILKTNLGDKYTHLIDGTTNWLNIYRW